MADNRDAAIYNIKAVSRLTDVAADTLRRWESRYSILSPQRSTGGYRMYSQRDVDTIRWLKARVDEGLTISRACELLRSQGDMTVDSSPSPPPVVPDVAATPEGVRSLPVLMAELLQYMGRLEEGPASGVVSEALALYPVEQVVEQLVYPALVEVGESWVRGAWTVAQEHFASAFLRGRLANLLHSSPFNSTGPLVLVGCAPQELHEIGALIIALYLRRAGYRVIYLGQNVPLDSLASMVRTLRPRVVCLSASRPDTASALSPLPAMLEEIAAQTTYRPLLTFGGGIFNRHPNLAAQLGAVYLGPSASAAVQRIHDLIA